jgi:hypothetical protein
MADLSITPANVAASASAVINRSYNFGATIDPGETVILDSDRTWQLLDLDSAANGNNTITTLRGIALNGGNDGQPASVVLRDPDFTPGATLTNGSALYGSTTAGGLTHDVPTSNAYPVSFGIAKSTSKMNLNITPSGAIIS